MKRFIKLVATAVFVWLVASRTEFMSHEVIIIVCCGIVLIGMISGKKEGNKEDESNEKDNKEVRVVNWKDGNNYEIRQIREVKPWI